MISCHILAIIVINQSINQSTNQATNQPTKQSINQPTNQATNQSTKQASNQSINQSTNQPTNQPINQSIDQSINQPTNQSINQSINQSNITVIININIKYGPCSWLAACSSFTQESVEAAPSFATATSQEEGHLLRDETHLVGVRKRCSPSSVA